ncbi:MAG: hypothetical protein KDK75_14480 [Alphaproteobacteria bacterium]|nr:hypothetical protein [Alphaproteobacteria bacterium]
MDEAGLEAAILAAHAAGDEAALARLYGAAGDLRLAAGDIDAACFFHTQAHVFALSAADLAAAAASHALLKRYGREE